MHRARLRCSPVECAVKSFLRNDSYAVREVEVMKDLEHVSAHGHYLFLQSLDTCSLRTILYASTESCSTREISVRKVSIL